MSNKNSRHTPSPSPSSPPLNPAPSKLPRFLQNKNNRDRSKSVTDTGPGSSPTASSSSASPSPEPYQAPKPRKTSKFLSINRKNSETPPLPENLNDGNTSVEMDETPVIVEPVNIPRPRTRSERPANSAPESHHIPTLYSSTSSTSRIGDLPTRLSGWFSHTFSTSSTDLSLPNLLAQQSPKGKGPSALLTAAKHGKGHLDKAMRYLLDSDATPDKCTDPIWLLGVQHPGYEPPLPSLPTSHNAGGRRTSGSPPSFRSSTSSITSTAELSLSQSQKSKHQDPAAHWPPVFYIDFTSRIWLTYRSHFPTPIRDARLGDLTAENWEVVANSPTTVKSRPWNWGGEKTWTSDSGWGCMLRTGQSLLANALVHVHLGRDWRRPPYPVQTADYATYVQILTWFLDTPSPEAPFSVHRMALAGKELGTDVGQWFGPSVAAGAIRTLTTGFPDCGLSVALATDSTLYQNQVFAASHGETTSRSPRRQHSKTWGDRPVLLLLGIRLGIEGVNPIYYETIKLLYTFPQSVGIAGGRPSSSYYFVGSQADNLFYLDPHNPRPAIPLRPPPPADGSQPHREPTPDSDRDSTTRNKKHQKRSSTPNSVGQHHRVPTSPSSTRTGSSNFSYHAPLSPSPLQQQYSNNSSTTSTTDSSSNNNYPRSPPPAYQQSSQHQQHHGRWRSASASQPTSPTQIAKSNSNSTATTTTSNYSTSEMDHRELMMNPTTSLPDEGSSGSGNNGLDAMQAHYCNAYSAAELKTFHCERVKKMPLSGLDPSMLIGFLCRDEAEWRDFRKRVAELPRTIFSIQDEAPTWPSDSDDNMGLESISEPDDMDLDEDEEGEGEVLEGEEGEGEQFFDTRSQSVGSASLSSASNHGETGVATGGRRRRRRDEHEHRQSEEVDTEEDPVGPETPGPTSRFNIIDRPSMRKKKGGSGRDDVDGEDDGDLAFRAEDGEGFGIEDEDEEESDIEDDWIDPSVPMPTPTQAPIPPPVPAKDHKSKNYAASSSSSPPSSSNLPPLAKGKAASSSSAPLSAASKSLSSAPTKSGSGSGSGSKSKRTTKKQVPVPVPAVKLPVPPQEHYPFPVAPMDDLSSSTGSLAAPLYSNNNNNNHDGGKERTRNSSTKGGNGRGGQQQQQQQPTQHRMHTARARDGGRTQSGGVKAILADD